MFANTSVLLSSPTHAFIDRLTFLVSGIDSIWLLGSRANGTFRDDSDWDFLIFGSAAVLDAIRSDISHRWPNIHLFVVTDSNRFESPWPAPDETECARGRLRGSHDDERGLWVCGWCWQQTAETEARYVTPREPDHGREHQAFRVYPE